MNYRGIAYVMGTLLVVTGVAMLAPAFVAGIYGEGDLSALLISAVVSCSIGLPLRLGFSHGNVLDTRDAIAIAAFGWLTMGRIVRTQAASLVRMEFVEAARMVGSGDMRIIFRHMVPSFLSHIIAATIDGREHRKFKIIFES